VKVNEAKLKRYSNRLGANVLIESVGSHTCEQILKPVKLPWMTDDETARLVDEQMLCRIAFRGDDYPYLAPFRYVVMDDTLYFHFTDYGKKMRLLDTDSRACVQIESYKPDLSEYSFVSYRGRLERVMDSEERDKAIRLFAETGKKRLSTKFLAAHGIEPGEGWREFTPKKEFVIVKLVDVVEKVGLKNP
jgi:nitroimidazol reductase NimA-like FMN-containing flavoprotein (pyridoxamine 5'-phosphate oxidase superfamily)